MREKDDLAVEVKGDSLKNKKILFGITGGIAATESIKLLRELRRYQAELTVMMTESAQNIITPLAVSWAGDCQVITNWEHEMSGLSSYDAILVAPGTRNFLGKLTSGIVDSPLMMAISSAKSKQIPVMIIPSMHQSMADDEKTRDLSTEISKMGFKIFWGDAEEDKYKQPDPITIVANFSNFINSYLPNRKNIVITLGATTTYIDDIRYVKNTSSGKTGYVIASRLHRWGHEITIVSGETSYFPDYKMPLVIEAPNPEEMLEELIALSKCSIDVWIHSAAVLDYINNKVIDGKHPSGDEKIIVELTKSKKHLAELDKLVNDSYRIGFKLESQIKLKELVSRASSFVEKNNLNAIIANRLEDLGDEKMNRAHLILRNGEHFAIPSLDELSNAIRLLIDNN